MKDDVPYTVLFKSRRYVEGRVKYDRVNPEEGVSQAVRSMAYPGL